MAEPPKKKKPKKSAPRYPARRYVMGESTNNPDRFRKGERIEP